MADISQPSPGRGGGPGGGRGPMRIDPQDRAQLAEAPVPFRRVAALFAPHRTQVGVVTVLIVATSVIGMAQPFLVREVIDEAIPRQNVTLLLWAVAAMLTVTVVTQLLGVVQTWISTTMGQQVMHALRTDVFAHLQRQSVGFFTRTRGGEIQSRIIQDISAMQSVVTSTATSIASNLTTAVATAVAMVALSWRLSLLSLLVIPPAIWLTRRVALVRREVTAQRQRALADLHTQVEEGLSVSGIRLAKTLGTTGADAHRFTGISERLIDLELRSQLAGRWRMATMQMVFAAIPALIYLAAGLPATSGGMTIGTLIAFTTLQAGIFRPLMGLLNVGAQWVSSMALFSRIFDYLDLVPEVPAPTHPVPFDVRSARGEVRFENVTLRYPGSPVDAVHAVDLTIPAGTTLAVVGHTGSGKSTLASLLPRLQDPTAGRVSIDGVDLRDLSAQTLAELVGVVSQETYLQHASIRENLMLARPDASEADLWQALAAAQVGGRRGGAARRPGHGGRRPRPSVLRRGAAAAGDRPHPSAQPEDPGAGRGDQCAGQRHRTCPAACPGRPDRRPHHAHHRAPAVHDRGRRPDRGARRRPNGRAGPASGPDRGGRRLRPARGAAGPTR